MLTVLVKNHIRMSVWSCGIRLQLDSAPADQDPPSPALQELLNWLSVQPDLVGGVPGHGSGAWDQMIFKGHSNLLTFYDSMITIKFFSSSTW